MCVFGVASPLASPLPTLQWLSWRVRSRNPWAGEAFLTQVPKICSHQESNSGPRRCRPELFAITPRDGRPKCQCIPEEKAYDQRHQKILESCYREPFVHHIRFLLAYNKVLSHKQENINCNTPIIEIRVSYRIMSKNSRRNENSRVYTCKPWSKPWIKCSEYKNIIIWV
jgi:hypothetical protein